jgi:phosphoribosylglycinamide formyltransferase-1
VKKIAIFASGKGSNAEKIIEHFNLTPNPSPKERGINDTPESEVTLIVSNKPDAGVLQIAKKNNISTLIIDREKFLRGNGYVDELKEMKIDLIVLAGFLWKIPLSLVNAFRNRIINIHPALLPKYGGKGLYGNYVHEAVLTNKEKESGITIHYVDEIYDHGDIIFQAKCPVMENDTPDSLAQRIHQLEHKYYPVIIKELINKLQAASH